MANPNILHSFEIVCYMLSRWTKTIKMYYWYHCTTLYYWPDLVSLSLFLWSSFHHMYVICPCYLSVRWPGLPGMYVLWRINGMNKLVNFVENHANNLNFAWFDVGFLSQQNSVIHWQISDQCMTSGGIFVIFAATIWKTAWRSVDSRQGNQATR